MTISPLNSLVKITAQTFIEIYLLLYVNSCLHSFFVIDIFNNSHIAKMISLNSTDLSFLIRFAIMAMRIMMTASDGIPMESPTIRVRFPKQLENKNII